jgi:hypothetical protein
MFVRLGTPPVPSAAGETGSVGETTPALIPGGISCYEVEMRDDGLLWIMSPDPVDAALREKIERAQRDGVPLFLVEGTLTSHGVGGEPMIEIEHAEVLSSFTARHLRLNDRPNALQRHE